MRRVILFWLFWVAFFGSCSAIEFSLCEENWAGWLMAAVTAVAAMLGLHEARKKKEREKIIAELCKRGE